MAIRKFDDLLVWQKSKNLSIELFRKNTIKNFAFENQIQRAGLSISNNIAEGFGRNSQKEFVRFLYISNASCYEVQSMILIGVELNFFTKLDGDRLIEDTNEISKMIYGLIRTINQRSNL